MRTWWKLFETNYAVSRRHPKRTEGSLLEGWLKVREQRCHTENRDPSLARQVDLGVAPMPLPVPMLYRDRGKGGRAAANDIACGRDSEPESRPSCSVDPRVDATPVRVICPSR